MKDEKIVPTFTDIVGVLLENHIKFDLNKAWDSYLLVSAWEADEVVVKGCILCAYLWLDLKYDDNWWNIYTKLQRFIRLCGFKP